MNKVYNELIIKRDRIEKEINRKINKTALKVFLMNIGTVSIINLGLILGLLGNSILLINIMAALGVVGIIIPSSIIFHNMKKELEPYKNGLIYTENIIKKLDEELYIQKTKDPKISVKQGIKEVTTQMAEQIDEELFLDSIIHENNKNELINELISLKEKLQISDYDLLQENSNTLRKRLDLGYYNRK